jgi:SAM-dependent methyltransferase
LKLQHDVLVILVMTVSEFYNNNAKYFSATRVHIWQCVKDFLEPLDRNASILEMGCGNGKNLVFARENGFSCVSGYDFSEKLVDVCAGKSLDVRVGNILDSPSVKYDHVLCIAVLHHLETEDLRLKAFINFVDSIKISGLLTVWSYEQTDDKANRKFELGDNMVGWNNQGMRYYYIYNRDMLVEFLECAKKHRQFQYKLEWERQNWCVSVSVH